MPEPITPDAGNQPDSVQRPSGDDNGILSSQVTLRVKGKEPETVTVQEAIRRAQLNDSLEKRIQDQHTLEQNRAFELETFQLISNGVKNGDTDQWREGMRRLGVPDNILSGQGQPQIIDDDDIDDGADAGAAPQAPSPAQTAALLRSVGLDPAEIKAALADRRERQAASRAEGQRSAASKKVAEALDKHPEYGTMLESWGTDDPRRNSLVELAVWRSAIAAKRSGSPGLTIAAIQDGLTDLKNYLGLLQRDPETTDEDDDADSDEYDDDDIYFGFDDSLLDGDNPRPNKTTNRSPKRVVHPSIPSPGHPLSSSVRSNQQPSKPVRPKVLSDGEFAAQFERQVQQIDRRLRRRRK